jgi:hypothetical protein
LCNCLTDKAVQITLKQQTANSKQQTANSKQQTANSKQQSHRKRISQAGQDPERLIEQPRQSTASHINPFSSNQCDKPTHN